MISHNKTTIITADAADYEVAKVAPIYNCLSNKDKGESAIKSYHNA